MRHEGDGVNDEPQLNSPILGYQSGSKGTRFKRASLISEIFSSCWCVAWAEKLTLILKSDQYITHSHPIINCISSFGLSWSSKYIFAMHIIFLRVSRTNCSIYLWKWAKNKNMFDLRHFNQTFSLKELLPIIQGCNTAGTIIFTNACNNLKSNHQTMFTVLIAANIALPMTGPSLFSYYMWYTTHLYYGIHSHHSFITVLDYWNPYTLCIEAPAIYATIIARATGSLGFSHFG